MRRFHFHLRHGDELILDDEGTDLPNLASAKEEALASARELLVEAIMSGTASVPDAFVIADETGREIDTITLAAVLPEPLRR
jgi:hypothetical protein